MTHRRGPLNHAGFVGGSVKFFLIVRTSSQNLKEWFVKTTINITKGIKGNKMALTVQVHQIFMKTFFASCLETRRRPQSLLREIINYLPLEAEFGGPVTFLRARRSGSPLTAPQETITLCELYDGSAVLVGRRRWGRPWRWTDEFLNELFSEVGWLPLKWYEVRKFAEFYLENGNLTTPIRPGPAPLPDEAIRREVDLWKGHFLHSAGTVSDGGRWTQCPRAADWTDQFNAEHQEVISGEGPILDFGDVTEEQQDALDDPNEILDEILQERQEGNHPYHITPHPVKETLREIQSIIDEDVKDLIPEGTYLRLMNKMKEAYDRS